MAFEEADGCSKLKEQTINTHWIIRHSAFRSNWCVRNEYGLRWVSRTHSYRSTIIKIATFLSLSLTLPMSLPTSFFGLKFKIVKQVFKKLTLTIFSLEITEIHYPCGKLCFETSHLQEDKATHHTHMKACTKWTASDY